MGREGDADLDVESANERLSTARVVRWHQLATCFSEPAKGVAMESVAYWELCFSHSWRNIHTYEHSEKQTLKIFMLAEQIGK